MYRIEIYRQSRNLIDAVVSGETLLELSERYYLYRKMHCNRDGYFIDLYEDDKFASRETFDIWRENFNKYVKEKARLKLLEKDFQ